jgi:hypothetical protein
MFSQPPRTDGAATRMSKSSASSMIASWPEKPRDMATKLMTKYGPPDEATSSILVWHNNGPWKRTILYKEEIPHEFPRRTPIFFNRRLTGDEIQLRHYRGFLIQSLESGKSEEPDAVSRCDGGIAQLQLRKRDADCTPEAHGDQSVQLPVRRKQRGDTTVEQSPRWLNRQPHWLFRNTRRVGASSKITTPE